MILVKEGEVDIGEYRVSRWREVDGRRRQCCLPMSWEGSQCWS